MDRVLVIVLALLTTACATLSEPTPPPRDFGQLGPTVNENVGNSASAQAVWLGIFGAQRVP